MKKKVEFKGTREGIILQLDSECDFEELLDGLKDKIEQGKSFFSGATVIGIEGRTLNRREKEEAEKVFSTSEIQVARLDFIERLGHNSSSEKVKTVRETIEKSEHQSDSAVKESVEKAVEAPSSGGSSEGVAQRSDDQAKIVFGTMRSGRSIIYPGHVIVVGDVNPGAEIVAEGHIVVMGTLRGVAHAGSAGDSTATITAFRLNPTQLRISTLITRPPEGGQAPELPEIARIRDGNIMIEPYL
ncbi:MAG: septum site-determining protein MinC [Acidaminobacter sp.]|uniref:septum site-determining protein MinC n=1 Tax=Acidaminobacter sp. TaxID=1872102 RepID=UPI00138086E2|nr:septum site-determining protein MinC [Acidaminobacter sp.]MZQ96858.1 septum site-determining protein MinC [Acidaminobacter sp.]